MFFFFCVCVCVCVCVGNPGFGRNNSASSKKTEIKEDFFSPLKFQWHAFYIIFCIIFIGNICLFHLSIVSIFLIFPCPTIPEIFRGHPGVLPQDLRSLVEQLDAKATTLIAFCVAWDGEMEMSLSGSKALRPRSFNLTHIY